MIIINQASSEYQVVNKKLFFSYLVIDAKEIARN